MNPSGKVPTSYPRSEDDTLYAGRPERYPGTDEGAGYPVIRYSEGLEIGYRWFQAQGIEPLFGFGFGLSYTTFDITDVSVDAPDGADAPVTVTASVTNTGPVAGAEVVQVYLGVPVDGQPPKRLVGFQKVFVRAGGVGAGDDHRSTRRRRNHPFGVWDYCTQRLRDQAGRLHRLRRQLGRRHPARGDPHRRLSAGAGRGAAGTAGGRLSPGLVEPRRCRTEAPSLLALDLTGTFAFALNGALTALRVARLDIVGVVTLGMITALGGGIIRDVLLGSLPPATFSDWRYLAVAAGGGLVAFVFGRRLERLTTPITVLDAAGLSLFAVTGASKALELGLGPAQAVILGAITGVGGGTLRDVLDPADPLGAEQRALRHPGSGRRHRDRRGRSGSAIYGAAGRRSPRRRCASRSACSASASTSTRRCLPAAGTRIGRD